MIGCHGLWVCSTFSIALANLFLLALLVLALWPFVQRNLFHSTDGTSRLQATKLPWWLWGSFLAYPLILSMTQLFSPNLAKNWAWVNDQWLVLSVFAILPALKQVNLKRLLQGYAVAVTLVALYGLGQYYWGWEWLRFKGEKIYTIIRLYRKDLFHAHGTFSHHLTYAGVMLMPLALFASLYIGQKKYWWLLGGTAAAVGLITSLARSAWLSSWFSVLLLLMRFRKRWSATFVFLSLGALMLLWAGYRSGGLIKILPPVVKQQIQSHPNLIPRPFHRVLITRYDDNPRRFLWRAAWHGAHQKLWLGHGLNPQHFHRYRERFELSQSANGLLFKEYGTSNPNAHNMYLQIWFGSGLVGLIMLLAWWAALFAWCAHVLWQTRLSQPVRMERQVLWGCWQL